MKRLFWKILGFASLGMAYLGLITPGLPYSIWVVAAAYCFSKGSPAMERWLYNHRIFGPFLINWETKRVFPKKMKYFMLFMMSTSLVIMYLSSVKPIGIISTAIVMALVAVWAWRYPSTVEEHAERVKLKKPVGWFK